MPPEHYSPDDPREWLARAAGDLAIASARIVGAYPEDLCFHAQQAAEKALKALCLHLRIQFPRIHDLADIIGRLENSGQIIPPQVREAARLTEYAVGARYPGLDEAVEEQEWKEAVHLARGVVEWVRQRLSHPS